MNKIILNVGVFFDRGGWKKSDGNLLNIQQHSLGVWQILGEFLTVEVHSCTAVFGFKKPGFFLNVLLSAYRGMSYSILIFILNLNTDLEFWEHVLLRPAHILSVFSLWKYFASNSLHRVVFTMVPARRGWRDADALSHMLHETINS